MRTPNGLRSPPWLPSVRSLTEAEPEARRHPAARDMGDRVRPRSTRPSAALAGTRAAALLTPGPGDAGLLTQWITADPPCVHALAAALGWTSRPPQRRLTSAPHGWPEEVSTKTQMIRRRMQGRVSFALPSPGSSSHEATIRYHRKRDRAEDPTGPLLALPAVVPHLKRKMTG